MRVSQIIGLSVLAAISSTAVIAALPDIRSVDWRNFSYTKSSDSIVSNETGQIVLRNGKSKSTSPDDIEISRLGPVLYADFLGNGHTEAAVEVITPVAARKAEEDNIYVFEWRDGKSHQVFFKMYESGTKMKVEGRSLVILEPDAVPPDRAHWTRTVFRWKGDEFQPVSLPAR